MENRLNVEKSEEFEGNCCQVQQLGSKERTNEWGSQPSGLPLEGHVGGHENSEEQECVAQWQTGYSGGMLPNLPFLRQEKWWLVSVGSLISG